MEAANFIDHVKLYARAGSGGAGAVHFRRARRVPKGGPDGGDGGRGGHIYLVGKPQLATLLPLKYRKHLVAPAGQPGSKQLCSGADGQDLFIDVPLGTVVKDAQTLTVQAEITRPGQQYRLMRGGAGRQRQRPLQVCRAPGTALRPRRHCWTRRVGRPRAPPLGRRRAYRSTECW